MKIARVYDAPQPDEQRVLVDRLWPRGIAKDDERIGTWLPEVAPSKDLRSWYHHDESRHQEFASRYQAELDELADSEQFADLKKLAADKNCVLVTATRELDLSHVPVLVDYLGAEVVPDTVAADPIETIERWELFGGAWQVGKRDDKHVEIELLRCDGGELVEVVKSDDPKVLKWVDKHKP